MTCTPARLRHRFHRIDDGVIAGAAAVIARKMLADLVARYGIVGLGRLQQFLRRQSACRACRSRIAGVALLERRLQIGESRLVSDRPSMVSTVAAVALHRQHQAAAHDLAIRRARCRRRRRHVRSRCDCRSGPRSSRTKSTRVLRASTVSETRSPLTVSVMSRDMSLMAAAPSIAPRRAAAARRRDASSLAPLAWMSSCGSRSSAATAPSISPRVSAASDAVARSGVCQRRNKPAAHLLSALPSARAVAAESDNGVVAVPPRQFGKAGARVCVRRRHANGGQYVLRPQRGFVQALEIVGSFDGALALRTLRVDFAIKRQQTSRQFRRRIGEGDRAAERAAVADARRER